MLGLFNRGRLYSFRSLNRLLLNHLHLNWLFLDHVYLLRKLSSRLYLLYRGNRYHFDVLNCFLDLHVDHGDLEVLQFCLEVSLLHLLRRRVLLTVEAAGALLLPAIDEHELLLVLDLG